MKFSRVLLSLFVLFSFSFVNAEDQPPGEDEQEQKDAPTPPLAYTRFISGVSDFFTDTSELKPFKDYVQVASVIQTSDTPLPDAGDYVAYFLKDKSGNGLFVIAEVTQGDPDYSFALRGHTQPIPKEFVNSSDFMGVTIRKVEINELVEGKKADKTESKSKYKAHVYASFESLPGGGVQDRTYQIAITNDNTAKLIGIESSSVVRWPYMVTDQYNSKISCNLNTGKKVTYKYVASDCKAANDESDKDKKRERLALTDDPSEVLCLGTTTKTTRGTIGSRAKILKEIVGSDMEDMSLDCFASN